ncbi:hypothetical protein G7B40_007995 [Aetokthonos hydrillicola Thurmond2011]|jgi:hypothetical protein|uniref:Uncharacterized protein n=1 Tax=Aetokthonos hydrillicola Thurmond2011 TaxID=2712845 RepID=A0AAP5M9L0_9CYAN|nr:hypothetical protein [Aetokthonos hydrillicola]MBO3460821.1 hypothetical protein [Aetokthonos hydrillicola CCALA 1050]MBW4585614.1 hypothetical protein [Aetokthonos hydrillicola CCALA 1050]MDR9894514.1 hypothetical protein [Aetokthonos hydrillicola Thurmond2011]
MARIQASSNSHFAANAEIWNSLKYAIAASSGFQSWLLEHHAQFQELELDQQVQRYLRETLETLAY